MLALLAGETAPAPLASQVADARDGGVDAPSSVRVLRSANGRTLPFDEARLRAMLAEARELRRILEEDPRVLYYLGVGPSVEEEDPSPAYPWNAVRVESDSVVRIVVPGNYREADRGYHSYAVLRMRTLREGEPAVSCEAAVREEVARVSVFVDGWILARTLFGGPAFEALDEFAFAREAGHLPAMVVELEDDELRGCLDRWSAAHARELADYRRWRSTVFSPPSGYLPGGVPGTSSAAPPGGVPGGGPAGTPSPEPGGAGEASPDRTGPSTRAF